MDKLHQISACVWNDAHGSDGTISIHEIDHKPYVYTTVGFLLLSDEIGVSIASEMGEDGKFRDITFIPRAMVVKEFPISPKRKPRAKHPPNKSPTSNHINPSNPSTDTSKN